MSNSHGLVPFGGRWQFSRKSIHSLSAIFRIPAGANFAATRIGCRSFQGNFNADLRLVQDFPSSDISSNHCLFGHQLKSTFSTKRNTWDQHQTFKDANSSALLSLHNHLDGLPIFLQTCQQSNVVRGFQADRAEHDHKEPVLGRGLAGGGAPTRSRGRRGGGRAGRRGGWRGDQQSPPLPPAQGKGPHPLDRLLATPVEQDGKRFRSLCQEGSVSAQVQVDQPQPEVLLGAGVHGDVHQGSAWAVSLRRGGRLDCGQAEAVHQEKWT